MHRSYELHFGILNMIGMGFSRFGQDISLMGAVLTRYIKADSYGFHKDIR